MSISTSSRTKLTLKGSTEIVAEFFHFCINSILYQRGIYPPDQFKRESKYGLAMMVATDERLKRYMIRVLSDLEGWLNKGDVYQVVVVVKGVDSGDIFERWVFEVDAATDKENIGVAQSQPALKTSKDILSEISALLRQITATVTFLPMLPEDDPPVFDILIYTDRDSAVPIDWTETDAQALKNAETVKLRNFNTNIHKVDASVAYRVCSVEEFGEF
jgi:mitotic spindle assembly checkpoint protein MAD2